MKVLHKADGHVEIPKRTMMLGMEESTVVSWLREREEDAVPSPGLFGRSQRR